MRSEHQFRRTQLAQALKQVRRVFNLGAVHQFNEAPGDLLRGTLSTGVQSIDRLVGGRGLQRGCIAEIFGPASSGKTSLALHCIAAAQQAGENAAFIDAEHALSRTYVTCLGVDPSSLLISQPRSGEAALEITEALIRSSGVGLVVVDSVAALVPRAELEDKLNERHLGVHARMMSEALRRITGLAKRYGTTVLFINQVRTKLRPCAGVVETTTGGRALKFYSTLRIELRQEGLLQRASKTVGVRIRVLVIKNRAAPGFQSTEIDLYFDRGICPAIDLIQLGVKEGVIHRRKGALIWDGRAITGKSSFAQELRQEPNKMRRLREQVSLAHHTAELDKTARLDKG